MLILGKFEWKFVVRFGRGVAYVTRLGPRFIWVLCRAYVIDGIVINMAALFSPYRRKVNEILNKLLLPVMLKQIHELESNLASRSTLRAVVMLDDLGFSIETLELVRSKSKESDFVILGEFDHYGRVISNFGLIEGVECIERDQSRPRERNKVLLVMMSGAIYIRKEYQGENPKHRLVNETRVLERLRESGARVPEVIALDTNALVLTMTFLLGTDLERLLETKGARLTGSAVRERLGGSPTYQEIFSEYLREGAQFSKELDPDLVAQIHEQVQIAHRHGVELYDIKYGNIIIHRDSKLPYLMDFDSAQIYRKPKGLAFLIERDRDIERFNIAFGTSFLTYDRIKEKLKKRTFPAADILYASTYIGHGLRIGPLWDRTTGFGRWHYIIKRSLHFVKGSRLLSLGPNNASIEIHLLRAGAVKEVVVYERDKDYASQGQFLLAACEWADNAKYNLRYVLADMQEAVNVEGGFDCAMALCSLYYLSEHDMRRVVEAISKRSPRFILQCNIREGIGREESDQYRRASQEFAIELLRGAGFDDISITAPKGFSRPLVEGCRGVESI